MVQYLASFAWSKHEPQLLVERSVTLVSSIVVDYKRLQESIVVDYKRIKRRDAPLILQLSFV